MSAVREMVGVDEVGGPDEVGGGSGSAAGPEDDGLPDGRRIPVQPWPRLVREVAPVYGAGAGEELGAAGDGLEAGRDGPARTGTPGLPFRPRHPRPRRRIPDPDDELFTLGERCAEAYMQSDALQYQAMRLLVEFHRREGWRDTGFSSTAEWLAWRIGIQPGAARERLRTALALDDLPLISEAME